MQSEKSIRFRKANQEDALFIAQCAIAATGGESFEGENAFVGPMRHICAEEDTLYSYVNSLIAEVDGEVAGAMISYVGDSYRETRRRTEEHFAEIGGKMMEVDAETFPGEYYIDSLAIRPKFRGWGLGKVFIQKAMDFAKELGASKLTLCAEATHSQLIAYYRSAGFEEKEHLHLFGDEYIRMMIEL